MSAKRIARFEGLGSIPSHEQRAKARELMAPYLAEFQRAADEQTTQDFSGRQELPAPPLALETARQICIKINTLGPRALEQEREEQIAAIIAERVRPLVQMLAELATSVEPMIALLQESRRRHTMTPCGLRYEHDNARCTCGADEFNAKVDAVLHGQDQ